MNDLRLLEGGSRNGVLTKVGAAVVGALILLGSAGVLGWHAHGEVPDQASVDKRLQAIELKLEVISQDLSNAKGDLRAVTCRLNINNSCPPEDRNC